MEEEIQEEVLVKEDENKDDVVRLILKGSYPQKDFYFYLIKELSKSPSTAMQYCRCVIQMFKEKPSILKHIEEKDKMLLAREVRKYAVEKNRKYPISALFAYLGFQFEKTNDEFFLTVPQYINFETKKVKVIMKKYRSFISITQVKELINHLSNMKTKYSDEVAMFAMIQFETACRGGALHKARIRDLDWDEEQIRYWLNLVEKGRKRTRLPLSRSLSAYLREYLKKIEIKDMYREKLFSVSYTHLWLLLKRTGKDKMNIVVHPHVFRRANATMLYNQTKDAKAVQKKLGHSKIATTYECYIDTIYNPEDTKIDEVEW